jgi:hypothetical protein
LYSNCIFPCLLVSSSVFGGEEWHSGMAWQKRVRPGFSFPFSYPPVSSLL